MALHLLGEHEEELSLIRLAQAQNQGTLVNAEVRALAALGRVEELTAIVEERLRGLRPGQSPLGILDNAALELDAHGFPEVAADFWRRALGWFESRPVEEMETGNNRLQTARLLVRMGQNQESLDLVEGLANEFPENLTVKGMLGALKARLGDQGEAEMVSEQLRNWEGTFLNGAHTYWRARIAASLGDPEEAVSLLNQAVEEGILVRNSPHRSVYFKPLRGHPAFEEFLRPKG
jgi:tetratricopeptide (TPR) repeat protein